MNLPPLPGPPFAVLDEHGKPADDRMQDYARSYGAACREAALEEAAKTCLAETQNPDDPDNDVWSSAYRHVAEDCAKAIRSLKESHG